MRLDKYLKVSRLIKRRTVAKQACEGGHVVVNDQKQKSAYRVEVGDVITINFGSNPLTVRVTKLDETATKQNAAELYEVMESA